MKKTILVCSLYFLFNIICQNISAQLTDSKVFTNAAFTFKTAVYSLELVRGSVVTPFIYGNLTLEAEVTR